MGGVCTVVEERSKCSIVEVLAFVYTDGRRTCTTENLFVSIHEDTVNPPINYLRLYKAFGMKEVLFVIVVLNIFGSLAACSGKIPATGQAYMTPTLSPQPDWLVRWLNEPVCQPPCWENITPGKTSFTDALAIVYKLEGSKVTRVDNDVIQLHFNQYGANYSALLLSRGETNIQEIDLDTQSTSLKLSVIVDRYGFPDEMIKYGLPSTEFSSIWIDLLYYDLGMVITFYALPDDPWNKISLSPDTSIASIQFYAPQLKYYFNEPPEYGVNVSPAIKLKGYGIYNIPEGRLSP